MMVASKTLVFEYLNRVRQSLIFPTGNSTLPLTRYLYSSEDHYYLYHFSVGGDLLTSRAIVIYEGQDSGDGKWTCSKDGRKRCHHIHAAHAYLKKALSQDGSGIDPMSINPNESLKTFRKFVSK